MKRYKNILVAFDGSSPSIKALETAETLTKDYQAQLTVAFVYGDASERTIDYETAVAPSKPGVTTVDPHIGPGPIATPSFPTPENMESDEPERILAIAKNKLSHDVDATFDTLIGNPADKITAYAKDNDIDLIIMGHRGLSGLRKFVMGSVSHKVTNKAECSVFVVK